MFKLGVFGVDYRSASFEIREKMSFSSEEIPQVLLRLQNAGVVREVLILSTCNRMEVYCVAQDMDFVVNAICEIKNMCPHSSIKKYSYVYTDIDCVNHLFRVVSGLESMVLGETEIVAQIKHAFNLAKSYNTVSSTLIGIFQMALAVEKDVRNATGINNIAISMGNAIVNLIAVHLPNIANEKILCIGAGDMMRKIAPHISKINCAGKMIVNRSIENARTLAQPMGLVYSDLNNLPVLVNDYSVMVACVSSKSAILDYEILEERINTNKPLLILDLSMPLVTNLNLRKYDNVTVLTVDDIAKIVDVGLDRRKSAVEVADKIIAEKLVDYQNWEKKRGLSPVIKSLRDNAEIIRNEVLSSAQKQLQNGVSVDTVLNELSLKLMNKLLHAPTVNLCNVTDKSNTDVVALVSYLYNLDMKVE